MSNTDLQAAWREVGEWRRRYDDLAKMLANHAALQRPPMMLADKESYEAGRSKGASVEREKVAAWMIERSYATGHGDTTEDMLKELEWQVRESEREACIAIVRHYERIDNYADPITDAIRARGQA